MGENEVPGETIGSMTADEVNAVSARLSEIVRRGRLPEKMLVVHQFTRDMIENRERLRRYPGVELVLNVDGFGDRTLKVDKYKEFVSGRFLFRPRRSGRPLPGRPERPLCHLSVLALGLQRGAEWLGQATVANDLRSS